MQTDFHYSLALASSSAFAFFIAFFFLHSCWIFSAASSISLSGFKNSSPISYFFSASRSYPSFGSSFGFASASAFFLASAASAFSFFAAYFFFHSYWILRAAASISLSGFKNSSPISWFFSASLSYPSASFFVLAPSAGFSSFLSSALASASYLAFFFACFFFHSCYIFSAASSISLSGFKNSSPIS